MIRLVITAALIALMGWCAYQLFQRALLAALVVLMLAMAGCSYYIVPAKPKVRFCYPANSWRCDPRIEWSQM